MLVVELTVMSFSVFIDRSHNFWLVFFFCFLVSVHLSYFYPRKMNGINADKLMFGYKSIIGKKIKYDHN